MCRRLGRGHKGWWSKKPERIFRDALGRPHTSTYRFKLSEDALGVYCRINYYHHLNAPHIKIRAAKKARLEKLHRYECFALSGKWK